MFSVPERILNMTAFCLVSVRASMSCWWETILQHRDVTPRLCLKEIQCRQSVKAWGTVKYGVDWETSSLTFCRFVKSLVDVGVCWRAVKRGDRAQHVVLFKEQLGEKTLSALKLKFKSVSTRGKPLQPSSACGAEVQQLCLRKINAVRSQVTSGLCARSADPGGSCSTGTWRLNGWLEEG